MEKARSSRNPVAIEPGRYTVVLEPTAVGNLVQLIMGSLNARGADEGRSFFSKPGGGTKLGMKVVDERVTIYSDPMDPLAPGTPVHAAVPTASSSHGWLTGRGSRCARPLPAHSIVTGVVTFSARSRSAARSSETAVMCRPETQGVDSRNAAGLIGLRTSSAP